MKIILNGRERTWNKDRISYAQVCFLAYPNEKRPSRFNPSICFAKADQEKKEGILSHRESIKVKDGTYITCIVTGNS